MSTNPSHILIARNSRGVNNTAAALSSPTETHAAASGVFRSSGSPPWLFEDCEPDELDSELSAEEDEGSIDIDETFTKHCKLPGTVKVVVESTTFWVHKEILFFASPFFEAALSGNWSETGRPASVSSIVTISQSNRQTTLDVSEVEDKTAVDSDTEHEGTESRAEPDTAQNEEAPVNDTEKAVKERDSSLAKLKGERSSSSDETETVKVHRRAVSASKAGVPEAIIRRNPKNRGRDAVIVLKEEKASTFHDFLKFIYPQTECLITWNNVAGLMNIANKLCVTSLVNECRTFLLTHAAGKPIKAMRIAELYQEEELYRESSRFVLDNPGGWTEHELNTLTQETLLKLEKRRNWFLERVLKLGLTTISKEYQCCPTCPDPAACARILEDKWRQAYHAVFRFGPPQPSMVFRYLRMLEGISPPLTLTHTACQASAKAFIATLFDRMFSLGVRGSGADAVPLTGRAAVAAAAGPRRHFLYCTLKQEPTHKPRKSRDRTTMA